MEDLPHNLKIELSVFLYNKTFKSIDFLSDQSQSFIAWICPLLKPQINEVGDFLYFEGDEITGIFFIENGECGFVLPK
jgi:hypothetical protein